MDLTQLHQALDVYAAARDNEAAALRTALAAEQGRREEAERAYAEHMATHEPPRAPTVFGTSNPDATPGLKLPIPATRVFLSHGERPATLTRRLLAAFEAVPAEGGLVWLSIKEMVGPWFDSLLRDIRARYPGVVLWVTSRHEPAEFWKGEVQNGVQLTKQMFHDHQAAFEAVLEDHPWVQGWTIAEGSNLRDIGPAYFEWMNRPAQEFGMDSYAPGIGNPRRYVPPAETHGPRIRFVVEQLGRERTAIGETGMGRLPGDDTGELQNLYAAELRVALDVPEVAAALWWNSAGPDGTGGPYGTGVKLGLAGMNAFLGRT